MTFFWDLWNAVLPARSTVSNRFAISGQLRDPGRFSHFMLSHQLCFVVVGPPPPAPLIHNAHFPGLFLTLRGCCGALHPSAWKTFGATPTSSPTATRHSHLLDLPIVVFFKKNSLLLQRIHCEKLANLNWEQRSCSRTDSSFLSLALWVLSGWRPYKPTT